MPKEQKEFYEKYQSDQPCLFFINNPRDKPQENFGMWAEAVQNVANWWVAVGLL